jgi:methionine biosynthesis protein MetW
MSPDGLSQARACSIWVAAMACFWLIYVMKSNAPCWALATLKLGIDVIQQDLESGLALFEDNAFDVVLQLETLQQMRRVEPMLGEIARVGREAILSFPNFGYWQHRWQILQGRMPVSKTLPHQWFDTPNIRCATLNDFADLAANCGLKVIDRAALHQGKEISFMPNLRGSQAVFRFVA